MGNVHTVKIGNLKKMFAILVAQAYKDFKTSQLVVNAAGDVSYVAVWLNEILRGTQDEPLAIEVNVDNYDELFRKLQQKWSFTRPIFLQQLTKSIENDTLSQQMKAYMEEYNSFCSSLKLKEEVSLEDHDPSNPCLILIFESGTTFADIEVFLQEVFSIYKRYLRVHKIEPGSVKVILQFPTSMEPLLQACIDQKREAVKHYNVKTMQIQASPIAPDIAEGAVTVCKVAKSNVSPTTCKCSEVIITIMFLFFFTVACITAY